MFLGHSNSSKTTAMILAAADAQKKGHLPVFIITEKKWSWDHAVELGLQATKNADGEISGYVLPVPNTVDVFNVVKFLS